MFQVQWDPAQEQFIARCQSCNFRMPVMITPLPADEPPRPDEPKPPPDSKPPVEG